MPVPHPLSYDKLIIIAVKGKSLGDDIHCPHPACECKGSLIFTGSWVDRGIVLSDTAHKTEFKRRQYPIARCTECKRRFRVLSCEVLPYKTYSLPIIETACGVYTQTARGLRKSVSCFTGIRPDYTTLHGWLGGLGDCALDRNAHKEYRGHEIHPFSSVIAETSKKLNPMLFETWRKIYLIPEWKFKSTFRKDHLQACARLLQTASFLFPDSHFPLHSWYAWSLNHCDVSSWLFFSVCGCTAFQLIRPP